MLRSSKLRTAPRIGLHLKTYAFTSFRGYQSVRWEDGVAHSTYPEVDHDIPRNFRFTEFVTKDFHKFGDKLAIVDGVTSQKRTFSDLLRDIDAIGSGLQEEYDISIGDTIALMTPNHVDFFSCLHGAAKIGSAVTPVNPSYRGEEVGQQLVGSNSKLLIAHPDCLEVAKDAAARKVKETSLPCQVISLEDEISNFRKNRKFAKLPPTPSGSDETLYLPYSSGTTGLPKGVMLSHSNLVYNVLQSHDVECQYFSSDSDVVISPLPMFHIYGFLASVHNPIVHGVTMVTMKRFDLELFCKLIEEYKCTRMHVVPPILLGLSKSPIVDKYDLSSMRVAVSAAAPLGKDLENAVKDRLKCTVKQLWGMSELSPLGTGNADEKVKSGTVGPPVSNTQIKVIDVSTGEILGPNKEGELCIRGPQVMKGYLNAPEKTAECLSEDGWLRTGDIAVIDDHGFVTITDRAKELIKYKGFQIAPAELEDVLLSNPAVIDSCVIPVPDDVAGEIPRAYVVLNQTKVGLVTEKDIMDFVASKVAKHKHLLGGVVFCEKIPKTESGKILRRQVVAMDRAGAS